MKKLIITVGLIASSTSFAEIKNLDSHLSNLNSTFKQDDQTNSILEIGGKAANEKKCQLTYVNKTKIDPLFPESSYQTRGVQISIYTEDEKYVSFNLSALSKEGELTLKRTTGSSVLKAIVKNETSETGFIGTQRATISRKTNGYSELIVEIQDEFSKDDKVTCTISI